jgi:hypothetical protein
MQMDEPLAKITAGDWDPKGMAQERLARKTRERKVAAVRLKVYTPYQAGDYKATVAAIEEATSGDPELTEAFAPIRFAALCKGGDVEAGLALGAKLLESQKDQPFALNDTFWNVIDPKLKDEPDPRVARLALQAARRADELTKGENMAILDTLAMALFRTGDPAGAATAQEKALKRLEAEVPDRSHPYYKLFAEQLAKYRKAASEKADRP